VLDLDVFATARVVERRSGRCGDRQCANLCRLETAVVEVGGERRRVVSGGNCPKYDERSEVGAKLPREAPNPYRERAELVEELLREAGVGAAEAGAGPQARPPRGGGGPPPPPGRARRGSGRAGGGGGGGRRGGGRPGGRPPASACPPPIT